MKNLTDKALDIMLDFTASQEWEDICDLDWRTDEVQELLVKALKQGQTLPIDSVSNQRELLNDFFTKYLNDSTEYNESVEPSDIVDKYLKGIL